MKTNRPVQRLKTISNVLVGLALLDVIPMMIEHGDGNKRGADRLLSEALFYSWFAFLCTWVIGMIVGWVAAAAKKEGALVRMLLALPCIIGITHFSIWPFALLVQ